jgi:hypothetical protein
VYESYEEYERAQFARYLNSRRPPFFFKGACNAIGLETFFPGQGKSSLVKKAISICETCPVKKECFDYAYDERIEFGIWGGATADQRKNWLGRFLPSDEAWEEIKKD